MSPQEEFRERLAELAPLPQLLAATQRRLSAAQHAGALAQHGAAHLGAELEAARDKLQTALAAAAAGGGAGAAPERGDERLLAVLQARVTQLTELNAALKAEVERQK